MKSKLIAIAILAAVAAALLWYYQSQKVEVQSVQEEQAPKADLGSQIYERANNPVADRIPETAPAIPNPIDSVYKNPFK